MLFGFPPVLDLIQELIFRADASDAALPLVMASTPIRHGVRHEFHQYLPSFGSSSTWPGAGLGVVLVSTTKSGSRPRATSRSPSVAESDPLTLRHELSCSAASRFALFTEGCASMYFTMPSKMVFAFGSAPAMVATIIIPYQPLPQFCLTNADFHRL